MLEPQNEHFVGDVLNFSRFVATKSKFSDGFFSNYDLKIDVSCEASVNFQHMSQNATLATEFAGCQYDSQKTRNTARPKCRACHDMQNDAGGLQSAAHAMENATHPLKTTQNQKYRACHTKRLSTRHETCWNVTKRHACHAKRGFATFETETSKSDHFCRTRLRHGHIGP